MAARLQPLRVLRSRIHLSPSRPQGQRLQQPRQQLTRPSICARCLIRLYSTPSTSTPPPSVLSRLREDLKAAMRAKDTPRLTVLRAILADITNASKTSSPITDDLSLLTLLKKKVAQTQTAIEEFGAANRQDLVDKEKEQLNVLEDYAGGVKVLGREEVAEKVRSVVEEIKSAGGEAKLGEVMKKLVGPGGVFEGRMVEKSTVVSCVREITGGK